MSIIFSIVNAKGGTGKTTTTFNLGAALANCGKRVLLVDNDQQASLTKSMGYTPSQLRTTLATLMFQAIDNPDNLVTTIAQTILHKGNLDLLPANKKLAGVLTRLIVIQTTQPMFGEEDTCKSEFVLRSIVESLTAVYDYILIDCGPHPDLQMINALVAADQVIIPVQAHYLDAEGLPDTLEIVRRVKQAYNPALSVAGILLTMYKGRTVLARTVRQDIAERYGKEINVFAQPIDYSVRVAEHPAYGESLLDYAPENAATKSYYSMAEEVLRDAQT